MKKCIFIVLCFICMGWGVVDTPLPPKKASKAWRWHAEGGFKYPSSYFRTETFVDDVPASVEVFSKGDTKLCYWSLLGTWSTFGDFPENGVWLSPTERVYEVTYRAMSKGIASGHTQEGNIFYLKQKIVPGGEVKHSKMLVLIYPPSAQSRVSTLIGIVKDW